MELEEVVKRLKDLKKSCEDLGGRVWIDEMSVACVGISETEMLRRAKYFFTHGDYWFTFEVPWETIAEKQHWEDIRGVPWDHVNVVGRMNVESYEKEGWKCKRKGKEAVCIIYKDVRDALVYSTGDWDLGHRVLSMLFDLVFVGRAIAKLSKDDVKKLRDLLKTL